MASFQITIESTRRPRNETVEPISRPEWTAQWLRQSQDCGADPTTQTIVQLDKDAESLARSCDGGRQGMWGRLRSHCGRSEHHSVHSECDDPRRLVLQEATAQVKAALAGGEKTGMSGWIAFELVF